MNARAIVFIDGNNWYHALKERGVRDLARLDYRAISEKLSAPRTWLETKYYIGRVTTKQGARLYSEQRRFLSSLEATDSRIRVHLGRLEPRPYDNPAVQELKHYLANLKVRIDQGVYKDLVQLAQRHERSDVYVEKAVDVMLAVDMVVMAERDEYDAAYLLSADGDYTPAVKAVRSHSRKVYAASPIPGAQLAAAVDSFLPLRRDWFDDCYKP